MSRAISDKIDMGGVLRTATPDFLKTIQPLLKTGLPRPNMFLDIYKNRRSKFKRARIWMNVDLGTCRFEDLFMTNEYGEQLTVDLIRAAMPEDVPTIDEIIEAKQAIAKPESPQIVMEDAAQVVKSSEAKPKEPIKFTV